MPVTNRSIQIGFAVAALLLVPLFAALGELRPPAQWNLFDIVGEGGTALLVAAWMWIVLDSRPAGRVTLLLGCGLAAVALGLWADALDELFSLRGPARVDKWLESGLMPVGMLLLTRGLIEWRREQFRLNEHMRQRERLFRDHRAFDRITQLAGIDYLREQLRLEQRSGPPPSLLMVELRDLQPLLHERGRRDASRALQAVTHQLLLNLRTDDLLCRCAADRLAILLPRTDAAAARRTGEHLARMVAAMTFHTLDGVRWPLSLRHAAVACDDDVEVALARLNGALHDEKMDLADAAA